MLLEQLNNKDNYFGIFAIKQKFVIDKDILEQKYYSLMMSFHPDKLISASDKDRLIAVSNAGIVNHAYEILKDDLKRAEYLLLLVGINVSTKEGTLYKSPESQELLIQQMELREKYLEDSGVNKITAQKELQDMIKDSFAKFQKNYNNLQYEQAGLNIVAAKYLNKLLFEVRI